MLKTFSAALIVASMLVAPAMAAGVDKAQTGAQTRTAPASAPVTAPAPAVKPVASIDSKQQAKILTKPVVRNANARMMGRHHRHLRPHHRFHKKMGAVKSHKIQSASVKAKVTHIKRG